MAPSSSAQPTRAEAVRIAAFFEDDPQRDLAVNTLADASTFNNVVEGSISAEHLDDLIAAGLIIEPLEVPAAPVPAANPRSADPAAVAQLAEKTKRVELRGNGEESLVVHDSDVNEHRARIHAVDISARPRVDETLSEDVYHIRISAPITREQRLELDSFGVDIAAFEPPDRYRAFLTRRQYERVLWLPYVTGVTRNRFGEAVTPELVEEIEAAESPAAGFAAADAITETREFDLVLHRERDLEEIRALVENTKGARVTATSNLRIRLEAPVDAALLAALAALPEVRKLGPYSPPML